MRQYLYIFDKQYLIDGIDIESDGTSSSDFILNAPCKTTDGIIYYRADLEGNKDHEELILGSEEDIQKSLKVISQRDRKTIYTDTTVQIISTKYSVEHASIYQLFNFMGIDWFVRSNRGMILHSSFVEYQGGGYLFSAPCGTGKSTHAQLWSDCFGAEILNGDRAAILFQANGIRVYGMPYAGTSGIYKNKGVPLKAVTVLRQAKSNNIRKLEATEAFRYLLPEITGDREDAEFMNYIIDRLLQLIAAVPVFLLECLPNSEAAELACKTITHDR